MLLSDLLEGATTPLAPILESLEASPLILNDEALLTLPERVPDKVMPAAEIRALLGEWALFIDQAYDGAGQIRDCANKLQKARSLPLAQYMVGL